MIISSLQKHLGLSDHALFEFHKPSVSRNNAYALFFNESETLLGGKPEESLEYIQIRMLVWQLLHDPQTRTRNYHVVVLVPSHVSEAKRDRLRLDGAIVKPLQDHTGAILEASPLLPLLHVFNFVEYEKVAILAADTWLTRPMDAIFEDSATQSFAVTDVVDSGRTMRLTRPKIYTFAATTSAQTHDHSYPLVHLEGNATFGCIVVGPSRESFTYYTSVAAMQYYPSEETLWNDVHAADGSMPMKYFNSSWHIDWPTYNDFRSGIASLRTESW